MRPMLLAGAVLLGIAGAHAGEFAARARVVDVEPIFDAHDAVPHCRHPTRPPHADLGAALRRDLGRAPVDCEAPPSGPELVGYHVTYQWNGRRFTEIMREEPGDFIPVRVRVD